jgi:CheY-like chemotaxis protein
MPEDANSRKDILVVDDDDTSLSFAESSLKNEFEIHKVMSGKEALEFLDKSQIIPDLILLDILMPEMDGWEVFDRINDIAALKLTPIMFFTSLNEECAREKAYEIGAFDFITKPCKQSVLLERVKETLQKAESQKQQ